MSEVQVLDDRVGVLAAQINALSSQLVQAVADLDAANGWQGGGFRSLGHFLSIRTGLVPREAERLARLAGQVDRIPTVLAHARAGEISLGMCDAAARVATPENEAKIAEVVLLATPSQATRILAQYRRNAQPPGSAADDDDESAEPAPDEFWSAGWDDHGMYAGSFRLSAPAGELLRQAMEASKRSGERERDVADAEDRSSARRSPVPATEAIERMATTMLDQVNGDGITAPGGERFAVQVSIDVSVLARVLGVTLDPMVPTPIRLGERCHVVGGPTLTDADVARILCDSSLQLLVHDDGVPLWMGNEVRTANRHQRRALRFRSGGCQVPGCTQTRYVDAHHVRYHSCGGVTDLSNLVLLCGFHHRRVHAGELSIEALGDQAYRFLDRSGKELGRSGLAPPDGAASPPPLRLLPDPPADVGPDTPRSVGGGEPLTAFGLDVILHHLLSA